MVFLVPNALAYGLIGLLAGICPSVLISRFALITALKGHFGKGTSGTSLRRGLVLVQFSISVLMITGTWVVFSQWQFMVGKDPGYDKENVVILPYPDGEQATIRGRFLEHTNIFYACVTNGTTLRFLIPGSVKTPPSIIATTDLLCLHI